MTAAEQREFLLELLREPLTTSELRDVLDARLELGDQEAAAIVRIGYAGLTRRLRELERSGLLSGLTVPGTRAKLWWRPLARQS